MLRDPCEWPLQKGLRLKARLDLAEHLRGRIFSLGIATGVEGHVSKVQIFMIIFVCALGDRYVASFEPFISRSSTATRNT